MMSVKSVKTFALAGSGQIGNVGKKGMSCVLDVLGVLGAKCWMLLQFESSHGCVPRWFVDHSEKLVHV